MQQSPSSPFNLHESMSLQLITSTFTVDGATTTISSTVGVSWIRPATSDAGRVGEAGGSVSITWAVNDATLGWLRRSTSSYCRGTLPPIDEGWGGDTRGDGWRGDDRSLPGLMTFSSDTGESSSRQGSWDPYWSKGSSRLDPMTGLLSLREWETSKSARCCSTKIQVNPVVL